MILVNYTSLDALLPDFAEASFLQKLPTGKVQTLSRLADGKQRTASLLGLLLLEYGMDQLNLGSLSNHQINFSPNQKPTCSANIEFNITHSDTLVACAISQESPLGIDSETKNDDRSPQLQHAFNQIEQQKIAADSQLFLDMWVKKEAVVKAEGCGIAGMRSVRLNQAAARYFNQLWYLHRLTLDDNDVSYLASKQQDPEIKINYHTFADCVNYCMTDTSLNCHG